MHPLRVLVLALLSAAAAPADADDLPVARPAGPFFETEHVDVAVSGSVIVGVASSNALGGHAVQQLRLSPWPAMAGNQLCLTVLSRDGVYYSHNTYDVPALERARPVQLRYDTALQARLNKYADDELAMRARPGACETSGNEYYVLDAGAGKRPETIHIFVNSFGATDVFWHDKGTDTHGNCDAIDVGRRTSFDHQCEIRWPASTRERLDLRIERERYGREMPAADLTLFLSPQP
ncbi:hypothetical protein [Thauera sp.]|uniref:hypothetical protein n=1 Tax=Thauera sp. TaxID=1905334 RepID=UPI0039E5AE36